MNLSSMKNDALAKTMTMNGRWPSLVIYVLISTICSSDYNYVRSGDECVPAGLERIPSTLCTTGRPDEKYTGSSGYRLIAGNLCDPGKGKKKDDPVEKSCMQGMFFWSMGGAGGADMPGLRI